MKKTSQETIAELRQKVFTLTSQLKEQTEARKKAESKLKLTSPIIERLDEVFEHFLYNKEDLKEVQWQMYEDSLENTPAASIHDRAIFHRMIIELIDMFPDPK